MRVMVRTEIPKAHVTGPASQQVPSVLAGMRILHYYNYCQVIEPGCLEFADSGEVGAGSESLAQGHPAREWWTKTGYHDPVPEPEF